MFGIDRQESVIRSIRLQEKLAEKMDRTAYKHNISFNRLVVQCCEYAMQHLKPPEE